MEIMVLEVITIIIMIETVDRISMITTVEDSEIEVALIVEVYFFVTFLYNSCSLVGRGGGGGNSSGPSRFFPRGNNRVSSHEHSSSRRSSRSPDGSFSHRHDSEKYSSTTSGFSAAPPDEFSHRSLPAEALRRKDKSNFDTTTNVSN